MTIIGGPETKDVVVDNIDVPTDHTFRFNSITSILNWIVREGDSASVLSNMIHAFRELVIPSNKSRVCKS